MSIYPLGEEHGLDALDFFLATMRKDGSGVTTHGVESQVYGKGAGKWQLVHVPYFEDRQSAP